MSTSTVIKTFKIIVIAEWLRNDVNLTATYVVESRVKKEGGLGRRALTIPEMQLGFFFEDFCWKCIYRYELRPELRTLGSRTFFS